MQAGRNGREIGTSVVLESIEGGSLTQRYLNRLPPPEEAVSLLATLARAMHHARQQGVLHCTLRPSAVLLTSAGVPKITRFGLARLIGGQAPRMEFNLQGLTAGPPFLGETLRATCEMVRRQEPVPPAWSRDNVPPDLEALCLNCLRKNPHEQAAGPQVLAEELERFVAREHQSKLA